MKRPTNARRHGVMRGLTLSLALALVPAGLAAQSAPGPVEVIRSRNEAVRAILEATPKDVDAATKEKLKDLINGLMDFRELSSRALGKHWDQRNDEEKREFVDVFQQLIRNSSVKKLEVYRADSVRYAEPVLRGDLATVTTTAFKDRKRVEIVYQMHRVDGAWRAYDMVIDGASTVRNYRDSFYKEIAKTSYAEMYAKLVQRLQEES